MLTQRTRIYTFGLSLVYVCVNFGENRSIKRCESARIQMRMQTPIKIFSYNALKYMDRNFLAHLIAYQYVRLPARIVVIDLRLNYLHHINNMLMSVCPAVVASISRPPACLA